MGYTHVADICQFVSPFACGKSAGTWTPTVSSDVVSGVRTAADAAFDILIPISLPGSAIGLQGAKLVSVDVWYKIATAAADDFATVEIDQIVLSPDGDALTGSNPGVTIDADHDTAAERKAADEHKMNVALDTPVFIQDDEAWYLHLNVDAAAGTVFSLYGAQINYTWRV